MTIIQYSERMVKLKLYSRHVRVPVTDVSVDECGALWHKLHAQPHHWVRCTPTHSGTPHSYIKYCTAFTPLYTKPQLAR